MPFCKPICTLRYFVQRWNRQVDCIGSGSEELPNVAEETVSGNMTDDRNQGNQRDGRLQRVCVDVKT